MKTCTRCKMLKEYIEFETRKISKDGYRNQCRVCFKEKQKEYRTNPDNKSHKKEVSKQYYIDNIEKMKTYSSEYYSENKDKKDKYVIDNKDRISKYQKEWRENNKDHILNHRKDYYEENKEEVKKKSRDAYNKTIEDNPNFHKERYEKMKNNEDSYVKFKKYRKEYKKKNPHLFLCRSIVRSVLRRIDRRKEKSTFELLGYSSYELKLHMEGLFTELMSWENYGEWHIDHIKPVIDFDKGTPLCIINSLSNLRPLWSTSRIINGVFYEGNLNRKKY